MCPGTTPGRMDLYTLSCPRCGETNQFFLMAEKDRHLRRCAGCDRWSVIHGETDETGESDRLDVEVLGIEPECPVEDCSVTPRGGTLAEHSLEAHGESPTILPE